MSGLSSWRTLWRIGQEQGWDWLVFRLSYSLRCRLGFMQRRFPAQAWEDSPLAQWLAPGIPSAPDAYVEFRRQQNAAFFFTPADRAHYRPLLSQIQGNGAQALLDEADAITRGEFRFFENETWALGDPPDWHLDPIANRRWPTDAHWSQIGQFALDADIKQVWEPSRFAWAYKLVRAYWVSDDERYAAAFWDLLASWRQQNPPQIGVHWLDGQELALRLMAWVFAFYGLAESPQSTPQRQAGLAQMIAIHADRIAGNIDLARSMHNNHSITEAAALFTVGLIFPEFRQASAWLALAASVLVSDGLEQLYEDGAYIQHSFNYQRLVLHDCVWSLRLAQLHGHEISAQLQERVGKSAEFLFQVQDEQSGQAPNTGHNDGALILPLAVGAYRDYRPTLQAVHYLLHGERLYSKGPWDEMTMWLLGPAILDAPPAAMSPSNLAANVGGYYTLRSNSGFAMIRCASFRHRPAHADQLHVDVWRHGINLALDPGTYSYHAPAPWDNELAGTVWHNTVTVDDLDQMERTGRFLWSGWAHGRARAICHSASGVASYWQGEHSGYERLHPAVRHRRAVLRLGEDIWLVCDALTSAGVHHYRLHWLLADLPHRWDAAAGRLHLQIAADAYSVRAGCLSGCDTPTLVRADELSPRGWHSPHYAQRLPALSLAWTATAESVFFYTLFAPATCELTLAEDGLRLQDGGLRASVAWGEAAGEPLIRRVDILAQAFTEAFAPCISS